MRTINIIKALLIPVLLLSVFAAPLSATAKTDRDHEKSDDKYSQKQDRSNVSKKRNHSDSRDYKHYKGESRSSNRGASDSRISRKTENRPHNKYNPALRVSPDKYNPALRVLPKNDTRRYDTRRYDDRQHDTRQYDHRRYDNQRPVVRNTHRKYSRVIIPSRRHHNNYIYVQPFRYSYPRYKRIYHGDRFWGWLAFTAVTLHLLDSLDHEHQLAHERALYRASISPLGETIIWSEGHITGSVTPVWEGPSHTGQYCREYRHEITIDDRTEIAYGTACRNPDGTWEIVQ